MADGYVAEDSEEDDDIRPLSTKLYAGSPLVAGGVRLSPHAQHAAVALLDEAYADLTSGQRLMGLADDDAKTFAQEGVPLAAGTYGEMLPEGVLDVLWQVGCKPGDRFYDLGSGAGQAVFLAWAAGLRATGVELAPTRWQASEGARQRLLQLERSQAFPSGSEFLPQHAPGGADFVCGNALEIDFTDGDILFLASVVFTECMVAKLAETARRMKPGSRIVSYKGLPGVEFKTLGLIFEPTSWNLRTSWSVQEVISSE